MFSLFLLILLSIPVVFYLYIKNKQNFWTNNGIPQEEPSLFTGNLPKHGPNENMSIFLSKFYFNAKTKRFPFYGLYFLQKPLALAIDLEFIRTIMIKDFNVFVNRGIYSNAKDDPLSADLVHLESDRWRYMRNKLTPTFASGKMKYMFPTLVSVSENFANHLTEILKIDDVIDIRDLSSRFLIDLIGNVAFGIECNSLKDPNNIFRQMGKKIFEKPNLSLFQRSIIAVFQPLAKFLHIKIYHKEVSDFFLNLIKQTIDYREQNNIQRNDFMDLLIQLKNGKLSLDDEENDKKCKQMKFEEIAPQAFVFFTAGFEGPSTTLTYILYELGQECNQMIQEKARNEINNVLRRYDGELIYEALNEMTYLDQIINETLRKYPPLGAVTRVPNRNYEYGDKKLKIPKGTRIYIPIYGIHHDPEYFPNPEHFDPDRFLPEEIAKRPSNSFMPFGDGPRNCIAMRFGKMQLKIGLIILLRKYRFTTCERTEKPPIEFNKVNIILFPKNEVWLKVNSV